MANACDSEQVTLLDFIYVATDYSVISVGHVCLLSTSLYMLVLIFLLL